jgi:uncharacterized membrane protein YbhN (UPF0104 family)
VTREESGPPRRDRAALRLGRPATRRGGSAVVSAVAGVIWEIVGEVVFLALVGLVSWLVYGEFRWPFIAAVFLGVNAVLVLLALLVWIRRRGSRRGGHGPRKGRTRADEVRDKTGR